MESNKLLSLGALLGTGYFLFCKDNKTEKESDQTTITTFLSQENDICEELYEKVSLGGEKIDINCKFKTFNTDIDYIEILNQKNITKSEISQSLIKIIYNVYTDFLKNNTSDKKTFNLNESNYSITIKTGFTKKVNEFLDKLYDSKVELKDKIFDDDMSDKLKEIYSTNTNSKKNYKKIHSFIVNNNILEWNVQELLNGEKIIGDETVKLEDSINNKSFLILNINDKNNLCDISVLYLINDGTNNVTLPIDYQLRNIENAIKSSDKNITKLKNKYVKAFFVNDQKMKSELQKNIKRIAPLVNLKNKLKSTQNNELKSKIVKKVKKLANIKIQNESSNEIVNKIDKYIEKKSEEILNQVGNVEEKNLDDTVESNENQNEENEENVKNEENEENESKSLENIIKLDYEKKTFKNDSIKDIEKIILEYLDSDRKIKLSKIKKLITIEKGSVAKVKNYNKYSGYDFDNKGYDSDVVIDADYDKKYGIDIDYDQKNRIDADYNKKNKIDADYNQKNRIDEDYNQKNKIDADYNQKKEDITDFDARLGLSKVTTDIITNIFLKENKTYFNFIKLIITLFETAIQKYCKELNIEEHNIHFLYKGGSIIRLVAIETFHLQPGLVSNILNKYYSKYFKRSDSDFTIHVNHEIENYDQIQNDMKNISFLILCYIRTIFTTNKSKIFDFYKFKKSYQKEILQSYLKDLNENIFVTNPNSPYYKTNFNKIMFDTSRSKKADLIISSDNDKGEGSAVYKVDYEKIFELIGPTSQKLKNILINGLDKNNKSEFYVSYNDVIQFERSNGELVKFDLVRMKANFNFETEKDDKNDTLSLGGEVIDVSIPHISNTDESNDLDLLKRYKEEIDGNELTFYSYSLKGLIDDLEGVLWLSSRVPWDDVKYEKRISRLFFLYLVDLLRIEGHGNLEDRYNIIVDIVKTLKLLNKILKDISSYDIHMNEIGKISRNITSKYNYKLCNFSEALVQITDRTKEDNKLEEANIKDFFKICIKNCKVIMKSITELQGQIKNNGLMSTKQIYSIEPDTVNKLF